MKRFSLACLAALVCAACGGEKTDDPNKALKDLMGGKGGMPAGIPTGMPGAPGSDPGKAWEEMGKIELTDAMMENYVKLIEKMSAAEGKPSAAMLQAYSLNWQQWAAISGAMARASVAGSKDSMTENIRKQLERARKQEAEAPEDRKAMYRDMIKGYEETLARMEKDIPDATELDRKNQAVMDRWMERIRAAGRKK